MEDVRLSINLFNSSLNPSSVDTELLMEMADKINQVKLPVIANKYGIRTPHPKFSLLGNTNFDVNIELTDFE